VSFATQLLVTAVGGDT